MQGSVGVPGPPGPLVNSLKQLVVAITYIVAGVICTVSSLCVCVCVHWWYWLFSLCLSVLSLINALLDICRVKEVLVVRKAILVTMGYEDHLETL